MSKRKKAMLIGWDAADWKVIRPLLDQGKMPNLQKLVDHGVMGQIATLQPAYSPMLWTSIATGKRPFQHGVHGFSEPTPDGRDVQPVTNLSRKCKAIWNILNQNGLESIVIGWWPSHPAEPIRGAMVSDHYHRARGSLQGGSFEERWPLLPGTIHPPELAATLAELRMHPEELAGPMIKPFVPLAEAIDQTKDSRLAGLARTLCECVSIHSAATWLAEHREWDLFAVYYDAIDHFSHGFMRYHPPRQAHISERDFDLFQHVVSTAYQFHDQMLGTLLRNAGDDVTVMLISDHGFHPDHLRPKSIPRVPAGPAIEHRDFGIFVLRGLGIRQDEIVFGASVLDITPTLLSIFDLPVGADMDGKVLTGVFENPPTVKTLPSWEQIPGDDGRHPPHTRLDPVAARECMNQLVALGYIEQPDENRDKAVADTLAELRYNLGQSYQDGGRHAEAAEIFRELWRKDPNEQRFAVHLFVSCQALGRLDEMREIVADLDGRRRALFIESLGQLNSYRRLILDRWKEAAFEGEAAQTSAEESHGDPLEDELTAQMAARHLKGGARKRKPVLDKEEFACLQNWRNLSNFQPPVVDYLRAQVYSLEGWHGKALDSLMRINDANLARPGLFLQAADLYRKMGLWENAEQSYAKALEVDPDNPHAHLGMARVALRKHDPKAAAHCALECIRRLYQYPTAHFLLGVALTRAKDWRRAREAFRMAIRQNPNYPQAHLRLAIVLRGLGEAAASEEHFRMVRELRANAKRAKAGELITPPQAEAEGDERLPQDTGTLPPMSDEVVIISGLPRSGTSMVMQMLAASGMPILTDGLRQADTDNPRGYFEYEPVKSIQRGAAWFNEAKGKAVKVVAPLLPHLPSDVQYRVIFIHRNLDETISSQTVMLQHRRENLEDTPERRACLKEEYSKLLVRVTSSLASRSNTQFLFLEYDAVLADPGVAASRMNRFLGGVLDEASAAEAVAPELHRRRKATVA